MSRDQPDPMEVRVVTDLRVRKVKSDQMVMMDLRGKKVK